MPAGPSRSSFAAPVQVPTAPAQNESQMLDRLLAMAADYCARLSRASIDFVCLEDVTETIIEPRLTVGLLRMAGFVWNSQSKHNLSL